MSTLYEHDNSYIYDAILNHEHKILGPVFVWDSNLKIYKYSNTLPKFQHRNHKATFDPKLFMTRGDVINFGGSYRNENKMIFNGEKLEELYTAIDDYGSVPPSYEAGDGPNDFNIGYFEETIDHNFINWLSKDKLNEIIFYEKNNQVIGKVDIKNKTWLINVEMNEGYEYNEFKRNSINCKFVLENNKIILVDKTNYEEISQKKYLVKFANQNVMEIFNSFMTYDNLSFIENTFNNLGQWLVYKIVKETEFNKLEEGIPEFPFIMIDKTKKYCYELLITNNKSYELIIANSIKENFVIKEIDYVPINVEFIKKDNTMIINHLNNYIKDKINKYHNIKERIPFNRDGENILTLYI
jgi:hypothetical protein